MAVYTETDCCNTETKQTQCHTEILADALSSHYLVGWASRLLALDALLCQLVSTCKVHLRES